MTDPETREPTVLDALRWAVWEPAVRVGLPVALGTGAGYMGGGAAHYALMKSPRIQQMLLENPARAYQFATAARVLGGLLGAGSGAALAYARGRAYEDMERRRREAMAVTPPAEPSAPPAPDEEKVSFALDVQSAFRSREPGSLARVSAYLAEVSALVNR